MYYSHEIGYNLHLSKSTVEISKVTFHSSNLSSEVMNTALNFVQISNEIFGAVDVSCNTTRGEFRPGQTRQLPRVVDLKGRLLSCQSY